MNLKHYLEQVLDHLDCLSNYELQDLHTRIGIEIMERDVEWLAQAEMADRLAAVEQNDELVKESA